MAVLLRFYDGADVLISAPLAFDNAVPGTPTAAQEIRLKNDGDQDASNILMKALARLPGELEYVGNFNEFVEDRSLQVRMLGGIGGLTVAPTGWASIGTGAAYPLPYLAPDEGVRFELRVLTPVDVQASVIEAALSVETLTSIPLVSGFTLAGLDGVIYGIGDLEAYFLASLSGNVVENPGGADDQVQLPDIAWIAAGRPFRQLTRLETISNLDGDSAALASGEAYIALLSVGRSGDWTITKGSKATSPLDYGVSTPGLPEGELLVATVEREFDGIIEDGDIGFDWDWSMGLLQVRAIGGLQLNVMPGSALVGDHFVRFTRPPLVSVPASSTRDIWLRSDGTLSAIAPGIDPAGRALLLATVTSDGTDVTTIVDRRHFSPAGALELSFPFDGTLADEATRMVVLPGPAALAIDPLAGVVAAIETNSGSSGATIFDVEYSVDGGAWTSLFTSLGTDDRRPTIPFDATGAALAATGEPEDLLLVGEHVRLRARIDAIPAGTAPAGAVVTIRARRAGLR